MTIRTLAAVLGCAFSLIVCPALAAPPPKPSAKPVAAKPAKPVAAKPAAPAAAKPAAANAAAPANAVPPQPTTGSKVRAAVERIVGKPVGTTQSAATPAPAPAATPAAQTAAAPAAAPEATKPVAKKKKTAKKSVKKKAKKKKSARKGKVKNGRGSTPVSPFDNIDKNQLAIDHLADAETKSPLELLASYKATVREGDLETAAALLRLAANDAPPDRALIAKINDLLGIRIDAEDTAVLLEMSRAARASAIAKSAASPQRPAAPADASPVGARIQAAHEAARESVSDDSRIDALAAYKRAMQGENVEAAAIALSGALQKPIDEPAVRQANVLLELDSVIPADRIVAGFAPAN